MTCINNEGSFDCICAEGYSQSMEIDAALALPGSVCINVDECTGTTNNCDVSASGYNKLGYQVMRMNVCWMPFSLQKRW